MIGLKQVACCPFCHLSRPHTIRVNADRALELAPADYLVLESNVDAGDPQLVIVFDPAGRHNRPCPHTLSLLIDVEIRRPAVYSRADQRLIFTANFDHPLLAKGSPGEDVNRHLWEEEDVPAQVETPMDEITCEQEHDIPQCPGWVIWISGRIFFAKQPKAFFAEIRKQLDSPVS